MIARTFASHLKSASKNIFQANNQNQGRVFAGHLVAISLLLTPLTVTEVLANTELQAETPMDSILTIVNDDVITTTELEHRLKKTRTQLTASGVTLPPEELLRKQILERFILERIQLQLAAKLGIRSNDQDIERALGIIAKKNKITYNALLNKIKQQNIDLVSYRQQIGRQVIIQKLSEREVNRRTRVSESEIDLFIENRNRQIGETDTYNLSHIMIPIPENASSEAIAKAKKLSQQILDKLVNGANFSSTAIGYSKSKEALEGGKLGWRSAGQLPELFVNAISGLNAGQISQVIRSPNGFHILKVHEKRSTKTSKRVTQTRARHILLKPSAIRSEKETIAKIEQLKLRIDNGESFSTVAKAYSEDSLSAVKGGELGWVNPGQTVPAFEKVMDTLALNKLSGLVKSKFGYHLIEVLDRQEKDIGEQVDRNKVRRQIHQRKSEEKYQQWIRRIRDESFVRYMNQDSNS
jgi:peptidyl-prolyl cis-trans isomerase SurA